MAPQRARQRCCAMKIRAGLTLAVALVLVSMCSSPTLPPERLSKLLEQQRQTFDMEMSVLRDRQRAEAGAPHMRTIVQTLRLEREKPGPPTAKTSDAAAR